MKKKKMSKTTYIKSLHGWASLMVCLLTGFLCFSCADDAQGPEQEPGAKGEVAVKIIASDLAGSTRSHSLNGSTRALTAFEGIASDNELIHSCAVAFVRTDGTVVEIKELPEAATGVESQEFTAVLEVGNYTVYAFANLDHTAIIALGAKGTKINKADLDAALYDVKADNLTSASLIPMSGYLNDVAVAANGSVTVNGTASKNVTVKVVRMVGKMEFSFTNNSTSDITVKNISVKPGAEGDIKLLPTWGASSALALPDMTGATVGKTISKTLSSFTVGTGDETKNKSFAFYLREVTSNHPTGSFPISITFTHGDSTKEEELTALLYDLSTINRNDWIRVPITLTDRGLTLDVEFYPPIGGYPPVNWEDVDNEYYVRFATGGWFSIKAYVINKLDGTRVDPSNVEISIPTDGISNTGFFRKQPGIEASGELTGEIRTGLADGASSVVTLEVKLTDKDADNKPITAETFKRKIHFIYKKASDTNN